MSKTELSLSHALVKLHFEEIVVLETVFETDDEEE